MEKKSLLRYLLGSILSIVGGGVLLFWFAGKINWLPSWDIVSYPGQSPITSSFHRLCASNPIVGIRLLWVDHIGTSAIPAIWE